MTALRPQTDSGLLILGHGSTENADSSEPLRRHADELRARGLFAEVATAFWKEEVPFRQALWQMHSPEVFVVPGFISEGYFTRQIIPRELGLSGATTTIDGTRVHYCQPIGSHPSMTNRLLERAAALAPQPDRSRTALIIVGHGTPLNRKSTAAIKSQVERLRSLDTGFAEIRDAYMEEAPFIADWARSTTAPNVVVVPFFIADGLHTRDDIPELLGDPPAGRSLHYADAIGTDAGIADVILDLVADCIAELDASVPRVGCDDRRTRDADAFQAWARSLPFGSGGRIGELHVRRLADSNASLEVRHHRDADRRDDELALPGDGADGLPARGRQIRRFDREGAYRPLFTAPGLIDGWRLPVPGIESLCRVVDEIYPGTAAVASRLRNGRLDPVPLAETLKRQSGRYAEAIRLPTGAVDDTLNRVCARGCLKQRLWSAGANDSPAEPARAGADAFPLLCAEACPWLIGELTRQVDPDPDSA